MQCSKYLFQNTLSHNIVCLGKLFRDSSKPYIHWELNLCINYRKLLAMYIVRVTCSSDKNLLQHVAISHPDGPGMSPGGTMPGITGAIPGIIIGGAIPGNIIPPTWSRRGFLVAGSSSTRPDMERKEENKMNAETKPTYKSASQLEMTSTKALAIFNPPS